MKLLLVNSEYVGSVVCVLIVVTVGLPVDKSDTDSELIVVVVVSPISSIVVTEGLPVDKSDSDSEKAELIVVVVVSPV